MVDNGAAPTRHFLLCPALLLKGSRQPLFAMLPPQTPKNVQGKGVHVAVQQLCSLDVQAACHAACVVANLAACNQVHLHDALQQAGALAPVVELLKCSLDEQAAALGALRNLTSDTLWQVRRLLLLTCLMGEGLPCGF